MLQSMSLLKYIQNIIVIVVFKHRIRDIIRMWICFVVRRTRNFLYYRKYFVYVFHFKCLCEQNRIHLYCLELLFRIHLIASKWLSLFANWFFIGSTVHSAMCCYPIIFPKWSHLRTLNHLLTCTSVNTFTIHQNAHM